MTPENNQHTDSQQPQNNQAEFMVGALIGAVAGAAAALLLTPKTGKEMRHTVKEYAKEFEGEAYELAKEAKGVTKSLRQAIDEGVTNLAEHAPERVEKVTHQAQVIGNTLEQHITAAKDTVSEIAEAFRSGWEEYGETLEEIKEAQEAEEVKVATTKPEADVPDVLAVEIEEESIVDQAIPPLQSRRRGQTSHLLSDSDDQEESNQSQTTTDDEVSTVRPLLASQESAAESADEPKTAASEPYNTKVIEEVEPTKKPENKDEKKPTKTRSVKVEVEKEQPKKPGKKLFFKKK